MSDKHIGPIRVYAVWPYMRDHAKPTTPYAAEQLAKCRTYEAPSKAHIKRLTKPRTRFTIAPKKREKPADELRLHHNELAKYAKLSKSVILRDRCRND